MFVLLDFDVHITRGEGLCQRRLGSLAWVSWAGQVVKACNQIVVALTIEAVSEALVFGSKAGVDPAKILQVLGGGLAANRVMELRKE